MHEYTLIRSSRRTLSLEIAEDLSVIVRAPRLCGRRQIDRFVAGHEEWINRHRERQRQHQASIAACRVSPEEEQALRRQAAQVIPQRVTYFSERMGVTPTGIRITGAKKRFGSCSGKNSLCFSWRLMQYPPEAVDYVVVHELAHIRHHDHSRDFYAFVEQIMPDFRQRQAMLRN